MDDAAIALARRACAGDPAACSGLWRRYRSAVAAVVLAYRPRLELEDLVQEVALSFVRALPSLREPERFEPWLMQIARNVARSDARRDRRRPETRTESSTDLDLREAGSRDDDHELLATIATLPPELREPLVLKCLEGLSQRRVSELLDLPETTVETRLVRARRLLRDRLAASDHSSALEPHVFRRSSS